MDRIKALEDIKSTWENNYLTLGEKIINISTAYHSAGLELSTTAAFIKATPTELDALLSLGELDDDIIEMISKVNPPKTAWTMLSNASDEEIKEVLKMVGENSVFPNEYNSYSEFIYQKMVEISGPTIEQLVGNLSGNDIRHAEKKGEDFGALNEWERRFLKSIASQKRRGKILSESQIENLQRVLNTLADKGAIVRNSIDGDKAICDRILDALGR